MDPNYQTVPEMYARLESMIRHRNDTGLCRAAAEALLQPKNPFEAKQKRRPKQAISVALGALFVLTLIFLYFGLHAGR